MRHTANLSSVGCFAAEDGDGGPVFGCSDHSTGGADDLVVSPDGRFVYAANPFGVITELARSSNGTLAVSRCAESTRAAHPWSPPDLGCELSGPELFGVQALAIDPTGSDLVRRSGCLRLREALGQALVGFIWRAVSDRPAGA